MNLRLITGKWQHFPVINFYLKNIRKLPDESNSTERQLFQPNGKALGFKIGKYELRPVSA